MTCKFEAIRGKTCEHYAAPSLWCKECAPLLFTQRGIDAHRWPEHAHSVAPEEQRVHEEANGA